MLFQSCMQLSNNDYIFECPHCKDLIQVEREQINCRIFRHAIYKSDYTQIDPHTNQKDCELLIDKNLVYGCAKPFMINTENMTAIACDYI